MRRFVGALGGTGVIAPLNAMIPPTFGVLS
jgi:hypothetical protein